MAANTPAPGAEALLREAFAGYYRDARIEVPEMHQREWMRLEFGGWIRRPLHFQDEHELADNLAASPPSGLFASLALYPHVRAAKASRDLPPPTAVEVAFDLDCKVGMPPDGDGFDALPDAFLAARRQVRDLEAVLRRDYRIGHDEAELRFSGGKGYHVVLTKETFRHLRRAARAELLACLTGAGARLDLLFPGIGGLHYPSATPPGGAARHVWDSLQRLHQVCRRPVMPPRVLALLNHHAGALDVKAVINAMRQSPSVSDVLRLNPSWWEPLVACAQHMLGPLIDGDVLQDMRRMLRVPGSINGKTGLLCRRLAWDALDDFEPFDDANPHSMLGTRRMRSTRNASIAVRGEAFVLREGDEYDLPPAAAIPLVAQGSAIPVL